MEIEKIFRTVNLQKTTSIFLSAGVPPMVNVNGRLFHQPSAMITSGEIDSFASGIMNDFQNERFRRENAVNFTAELSGFGRFRVSFFRQKGLTNAVLKPISDKIPRLEELRLPLVIKNKILRLRRGLVIICGPAGSGKSTTLAAMIDYLNDTRAGHIVCLEDPIEFFHEHRRSLISQREIGTDSNAFGSALREAIRQDADVIIIGEMRDAQTTEVVLRAAETGILVLATMHTSDSVQTINRVIGSFPTDQQQQVRTQLAMTLKAIIAQQLLVCKDGKSRVPLVEIMLATQGIESLIREKKTHQIYSAIENGSSKGMQTMDQALQNLYRENRISDVELVTRSTQAALASERLSASAIPLTEAKSVEKLTDAGEEMINIDRKLIRYQAQFMPGTESYWTSSVVVSMQDEGLVLTAFPGTNVQRIYVSDFNIVSKRVTAFPLPPRMLLRFRTETDAAKKDLAAEQLLLKLFTQPEAEKITAYHKINLSFPLALDGCWHTWIIPLPDTAHGKILKIYMLEFPVCLTKTVISDIIFF